MKIMTNVLISPYQARLRGEAISRWLLFSLEQGAVAVHLYRQENRIISWMVSVFVWRLLCNCGWHREATKLMLWFVSIFRNTELRNWINKLNQLEGGLEEFTQGYKYFGLHIASDNSLVAREWAPGAQQLYLTGDFSEYIEIYNLWLEG